MDSAEMRRRVRDARVGRLATVTPEGRPHIVPCCFVLDGDTAFSAVDAKPKSTRALARLDNVRAYPVASLLVDRYGDDWTMLWWVRVDGAARVIEAGAEVEHAVDLLRAKYEQYATTRPPGPVLAIDVTTWRSWESG